MSRRYEVLESVATGDGIAFRMGRREEEHGFLDAPTYEDDFEPEDGPPPITHEDLVREMPIGTRIRTILPRRG